MKKNHDYGGRGLSWQISLLLACLFGMVMVWAPLSAQATESQSVSRKDMWKATALDYCVRPGDGKVTDFYNSTAQGAAAEAMAFMNEVFACTDKGRCGPRHLNSVTVSPAEAPTSWGATGNQSTSLANGQCLSSSVGFGHFLYYVNTCPKYSTANGTTDCLCNTGYVASAGECVKVPVDPPALACTSDDGKATAHPIIPFSGEKIKNEIDYAGQGPHALNLTRHYGSQRSQMGTMGQAWSHAYSTRLRVLINISAYLVFGDGRERTFFDPIIASGSPTGPPVTELYETNPWPSTVAGQGELQPASAGGAGTARTCS